MTRVRLHNVAKAFGPIWAVREVNLEIAQGEFFSLLGPSGCGKTTTLRIVAGLENPTRGEVWFGDEEVTRVPPQLRNIGLVFQSYAVFPTMTVYDNVAYGLRIRHVPEPEVRRRVRDVLGLVGLGGLADRMPGKISGGQMQRVALARALAIRPRLLLLDEPLSNLDAKLRVEVRGEIRKLQRELGITTIYVTHDQEEALSMSDRVGVMNHGVLEQVGRPDEVYHAPATRFVAAFVGEGTLFEGILTRNRSRPWVEVGAGVKIPVRNASVADGPIWVCVRPEAVRVVRGAASAESSLLVGVVESVEFVGPLMRADARLQGLSLILRLTSWGVQFAERLQAGEQVQVIIDPAGVSVGPHDRGSKDLALGTGTRPIAAWSST